MDDASEAGSGTFLKCYLSNASVVSLGAPMFLFLTVTYIPQEKGRITAIILPAMLTILLYQTTFIGAMHGMILLSIRLRFHIFGGMNDGCLYQQFIVLPLILALGVFVVRRGHSRP